MDPKILLKLPEIKSDTFLIENLKIYLSIQDDIYNKKIERNGVEKWINIMDKYKFQNTNNK